MFKKIIKKIFIFFILVAVSAIAFELFLDVIHYNTEILFQYQPDFGWSHLANKKFLNEGKIFLINRDGFRDINHSKSKPEGVTRIAFVSSHYLRGSNSSFEKIATTILGKSWNEAHKEKIEVFNFAMPNYNLEMVYFLIKNKAEEYDIDYFIYLLDPQKDPVNVASETEIVKYAPALMIDDKGKIFERKDFIKPPFSSKNYEAYKIYQFSRNFYKKLKNLSENAEQTERENFGPYPEVYFDKISPESLEVIGKMAKIMDYIIENNEKKVYFLILPPQQTDLFAYYEKNGNLNYLKDNQQFLTEMKEFHNWNFADFYTDIHFFLEQGEGNYFMPNNLTKRLEERTKHPERLIDLDNEFYKFVSDPSSDGFLYNWHRRDAGQAYLAGLLERLVIPSLLSNNSINN